MPVGPKPVGPKPEGSQARGSKARGSKAGGSKARDPKVYSALASIDSFGLPLILYSNHTESHVNRSRSLTKVPLVSFSYATVPSNSNFTPVST